MQTLFSLRIFFPDGDPDGLRIVDRTNWNGKALVLGVWIGRIRSGGRSRLCKI
jgi:hypothetical protein